MKKTDKDFFSFPICLLKDIFEDKKRVLDNIIDYAVYKHTLKLEFNNDISKIKASAQYFGITLGDNSKAYKNGKILYQTIPENTPFAGISIVMLFDFYKNEKTDFDIDCLLAYLSIKSILGGKKYVKTNKNLLISRMSGQSKTININQIPERLCKYFKDYHFKKLINELEINWFLKYYSRYTRGFFVSFDIDITMETMILEIEKNKRSNKVKEFNDKKKQIIKQVLSGLK